MLNGDAGTTLAIANISIRHPHHLPKLKR